jgi:hypothetical protein
MTKVVKIKMNKIFLSEYNKLLQAYGKDNLDLSWRSPSRCEFQDAHTWAEEDPTDSWNFGKPHGTWIHMTPESFFSFYQRYPNARLRLSLTGNNKKSYSRCGIGSVSLEIAIIEDGVA